MRKSKQSVKNKVKQLHKLCPECGEEYLSLVDHKVKRSGVIYNEPKIECLSCGYVQHNGKFKKHKTESIQPLSF